jgi:hypothetical protein
VKTDLKRDSFLSFLLTGKTGLLPLVPFDFGGNWGF